MKAKLNAGAELDFLTKDELTSALKGWMAEITRGVKFRQIAGAGVVAGGVWTIGGNQADNRNATLGPAQGFVWAVTRIAVAGGGIVAGTDLYSAYIDEVTNSKLIQSGLTRGALWQIPTVLLQGGEKLTVAGAGTGAGSDVTLSGAAVELPDQLAWRLLG